MSVLHVLGTVIAVLILIAIVAAAILVFKAVNLAPGSPCHFDFQCADKICTSGLFGLTKGYCAVGDVPPGSLPADNKTACSSPTQCAPGANGESACGELAGVPYNVCCASGDTDVSPCGVTDYCSQLPTGAPCRNDGSCASDNCIQPSWCQLGTCA